MYNSAKANSDYAFNYTEHLVKKEMDKKLLVARVGIILLVILLLGVVLFLMFGPIKIPHIAVVAVVLIAYVGTQLWGLTSIEYEHVIASASLEMDKIIAGRKRRRMVEFNVPEAEQILPLSDARLDGMRVIYAVSSQKAKDAYCAIYRNERGDKEALVFNAPEKSLKMLKYYNKNCVIK